MLQAHTEEEFQAWVSAIQQGVTRAYRDADKHESKSSVSNKTVVCSSVCPFVCP